MDSSISTYQFHIHHITWEPDTDTSDRVPSLSMSQVTLKKKEKRSNRSSDEYFDYFSIYIHIILAKSSLSLSGMADSGQEVSVSSLNLME